VQQIARVQPAGQRYNRAMISEKMGRASVCLSFKRSGVALLALVGAAMILWNVPSFLHVMYRSTMPSGTDVRSSLASPDHRYKAVVFNANGGGGFSPYCIDTVTVVPFETPDKMAWGDNNMVFESDCAGFEDIRWKSNDELELSFNATLAASGNIAAVTLKGYADSGKIKLTYTQR
jgi:hypothetical protein